MKKAEFGNSKEFKDAYELPGPGQFAIEVDPPKMLHWDHCREQFANRFDEKTTGFYFTHPPSKSENVANFITKTEEIIDLNEFSHFSKTSFDRVLWISPSKFWKVCEMRRSLLTILLRAGMDYDVEKDNYELALFRYSYALKTRVAIIRFLYGFTNFTKADEYSKKGWVNFFENADVDLIRKSLVALNEKENCLIGMEMETLWG